MASRVVIFPTDRLLSGLPLFGTLSAHRRVTTLRNTQSDGTGWLMPDQLQQFCPRR